VISLSRGQALAYALGAWVALMALLAIWFSATQPNVTGNAGEANQAVSSNSSPPPAQWTMPGLDTYDAASGRPLFSENREPLKVDRTKQPGAMGANANAPQVPLNITLGGVILSPNLRLAMVTDNTTGKVVALKEGMPMPGDLGGWTLREIERAKVTFNGGETLGDTVVELKPVGSVASSPQPNSMVGQMFQPQAPPPVSGNVYMPPGMADAEAQSRAEEIRRKVEQRRQELRDEAARLATEKKQ